MPENYDEMAQRAILETVNEIFGNDSESFFPHPERGVVVRVILPHDKPVLEKLRFSRTWDNSVLSEISSFVADEKYRAMLLALMEEAGNDRTSRSRIAMTASGNHEKIMSMARETGVFNKLSQRARDIFMSDPPMLEIEFSCWRRYDNEKMNACAIFSLASGFPDEDSFGYGMHSGSLRLFTRECYFGGPDGMGLKNFDDLRAFARQAIEELKKPDLFFRHIKEEHERLSKIEAPEIPEKMESGQTISNQKEDKIKTSLKEKTVQVVQKQDIEKKTVKEKTKELKRPENETVNKRENQEKCAERSNIKSEEKTETENSKTKDADKKTKETRQTQSVQMSLF